MSKRRKQFSTGIILALSIIMTGCGTSIDTSQPDYSPRLEPVFTPSAIPEAEPLDSTPATAETSCPGSEDALNLVNNWADVLASRGSSQHPDDLEHFHELVLELLTESEQAEISCPAYEELSDISIQAGGLEIMVEHLDVPEDRFYQAVTNSGNEWLGAGEYYGLIFKTP